MAKTNPIKFTGAMVKKFGIFSIECFVKRDLEKEYDQVSLELDHALLAFKDGSRYHLTDFDCIKANELGNEEYAKEIERLFAKHLTKFYRRKYVTAHKLNKIKKKFGLVKPMKVIESEQKTENKGENTLNK